MELPSYRINGFSYTTNYDETLNSRIFTWFTWMQNVFPLGHMYKTHALHMIPKWTALWNSGTFEPSPCFPRKLNLGPPVKELQYEWLLLSLRSCSKLHSYCNFSFWVTNIILLHNMTWSSKCIPRLNKLHPLWDKCNITCPMDCYLLNCGWLYFCNCFAERKKIWKLNSAQ